tara:strand:+ start:728 stop:886 length:159 start_codon:yes stop_codon:yes gene_type:complete
MLTNHDKLMFVQRVLRQTQNQGANKVDIATAMCWVADVIVENLEARIDNVST